jgi:hypothetical protein
MTALNLLPSQQPAAGLEAMLAGAALHELLLAPALAEVVEPMATECRLRAYVGLIGAVYGSMQQTLGPDAAATALRHVAAAGQSAGVTS